MAAEEVSFDPHFGHDGGEFSSGGAALRDWSRKLLGAANVPSQEALW